MDLSYKGHCFTEHLSSWAGGHQKNSRGHSWGKEIRFKLFLLLCIQASRVWNNLICLVASREALRKGKGRSASLSLYSDLSQFSMTKNGISQPATKDCSCTEECGAHPAVIKDWLNESSQLRHTDLALAWQGCPNLNYGWQVRVSP